jgi:hypothetical protein
MWNTVVGRAVSDLAKRRRHSLPSSRVKQTKKNPFFTQYAVTFLIDIKICVYVWFVKQRFHHTLYSVKWLTCSVNWKIYAINSRDIILGYVPAFTWRRWGKPQKTSVWIIGVPTKIRTAHPRNTWRQPLLFGKVLFYINIFSCVCSWKLQEEMTLKLRNKI